MTYILSIDEREERSRQIANEAKAHRENVTEYNILKQMRFDAEDKFNTGKDMTSYFYTLKELEVRQTKLNAAVCPNISSYIDRCYALGKPRAK